MLMICGLARTAFSQGYRVNEFALDRFELSPSGQGAIWVSNGRLMPPGHARLSLGLNYLRDPLVALRQGERLGALISDRLGAHVTGSLGIHRRLELMVQLPFVAFQGGEDLSAAGLQPPSRAAMGAPSLGVRLGLLGVRPRAKLNLAVDAQFYVPAGAGNALARDQGLAFAGSVALGREWGPLSTMLQMGARIRPATALGTRDVMTEGTFAAAATVRPWTQVTLEAGIRGAVPAQKGPLALEMLFGGRCALRPNTDIFFLAGPGLGQAAGTPLFRAVAGVSVGLGLWSSGCTAGEPHEPSACPQLDLDGDRIRNALDACPEQAEDRDDFEDADGCPDLDHDRDGVLEGNDRCPHEAGSPQQGGCPAPSADRSAT
jgi:OmpA-OmpF porin, OOP family